MSLTTEQEDEIIKQARYIEAKYFSSAELVWAAQRPDERTRPWPRCGSLKCNRTLVCTSTKRNNDDMLDPDRCQGFDF